MDQASCTSADAKDMYGIGIRLGFYLQWLAGALAALLDVKSDISAIRGSLLCFIFATFLALVVQTANSKNTTVDIYVSLLLCFGYYYSWPMKIWKPYTRLAASKEFDVLQHSLIIAVLGFKLWFWASRVTRPRKGCRQYGFLFCRLELDSTAMRAINILLDVCTIAVFSYTFFRLAKSLWPRKNMNKKPLEQESNET
jgi:hypothetical protein